MQKEFAKLFEYAETGQALFTLCSGDDGPEIRVRIADINGVTPEVSAGGYGDTEEGWKAAEEKFENLTRETAKELALQVKTAIESMFAEVSRGSN